MIQHLASKDNRHVVEAAKLKLAKYQKETGLFLVEGYHLLQMAIEHQVVKEVFTTKVIPDLQVDQYVVNEDILAKLAATKSPQGVVAVCQIKLPSPIIGDSVIFLDDISDPGNLGTLLRTALAFGYQDVIMSPQSVSPYNDRAVNASQGAIFALNLVEGHVKELLDLQSKDFQIVATALNDSQDLRGVTYKKQHVVVLGNESRGVSDDILRIADVKAKIVIAGIESLNVAVAAGIVLYEINRNK